MTGHVSRSKDNARVQLPAVGSFRSWGVEVTLIRRISQRACWRAGPAWPPAPSDDPATAASRCRPRPYKYEDQAPARRFARQPNPEDRLRRPRRRAQSRYQLLSLPLRSGPRFTYRDDRLREARAVLSRRRHDLQTGVTSQEPVLYDSRDLVTHGVCVGMTGSGKTGLCVSIIEEAAIDGIPVIAIDPKGDIGNLLLTFPRLAPEFRPWVRRRRGSRAGVTPDAFAAAGGDVARGLVPSGSRTAAVSGGCVPRPHRVYTPGAARAAAAIIHSFAAPPGACVKMSRPRNAATGTATSLLDLARRRVGPRSREHTLVSTLLASAWRDGNDLDLATLIRQIQSPPFEQIGVADSGVVLPAPRNGSRSRHARQRLLAATGFRPVARRRSAGSGHGAVYG